MFRVISRLILLAATLSVTVIVGAILFGGTHALDVLFYVGLSQSPGGSNTRFVSNINPAPPIYALIDTRTGIIQQVNGALPPGQSTPDLNQNAQPHTVLIVDNMTDGSGDPELTGRLDLRNGELDAIRDEDRVQPPVVTGTLTGIADEWAWILLSVDDGVIYLAAGGPNLTNYVRDPIQFNAIRARATPVRDEANDPVQSNEFAVFLPDNTFVLRVEDTLYHYAARQPEAGLIGVIHETLPAGFTMCGYSRATGQLVVTVENTLHLMDLTTGEISDPVAEFESTPRVVVSPDGVWAMVMTGFLPDTGPAYSVNLRDRARYPLDPEFEFDADKVLDARWSGNSEHIAFRVERNDSSRLALAVSSPTGENMRVVSTRTNRNYGWSPGGHYLLFMEEGAPPTGGFVYDAVANGDPVEVATPMFIPRWDAERDILYYLNANTSAQGDGRLYRYDARSGIINALTIAEQRVVSFAPMQWE